MDSDDLNFYDDTESENDISIEYPMDVEIENSGDSNEYPFEVLSLEKIVQHMTDCIEDVNAIAKLPTTTTRMLLHHYKWDKERLMERLFDNDQEKLFADARVVNPFRKKPPTTCKTRSQTALSRECGICFMTPVPSKMNQLDCEHRFCTDCWGEYLTTKIRDEGVSDSISCAAHNCGELVNDTTVMRLVKDSKVKLKYQHLMTNSFVQCNRLLKWCPSPGCNNAIKVQYVDSKPVTCKCEHTFCFSCGNDLHDPVTCGLVRKWIKKCEDDSETMTWISANTKDCPKCSVAIEKNGGCNHMVCRNLNCRFEFCWTCLQLWSSHTGDIGYVCNRYDGGAATRETSRAALERYLFYYTRYRNHMQSLKFESKLYASVEKKMEELQQHKMSWVDVQFLKRAVDILCSCRQTLMNTYVFAFYVSKNNQSQIFEDNQKDLEIATEKLSGYLEKDITVKDLADIKQKVQDKYKYCESRRQALLEHVHEGYERDWWGELE